MHASQPLPSRVPVESHLAELLGALSPSEFVSHHYLSQPISGTWPGLPLADEDAWALADAFAATPGADLVLERDGRAWDGPRPTNSAGLRHRHSEGYTLVLRGVDRFDRRLAQVGRALAMELHGLPSLQLYLTPANHGSFGWRCDPEEVFLVQTSGRQRVLLRANLIHPSPMPGRLPTRVRADEEETPVRQFLLGPGDWLYIPGGHWHSTEAVDDAVTISVGLMAPTALDALDLIRTHLSESPEWRARLAFLGRACGLSEEEKTKACRFELERLAYEVRRQLSAPEMPARLFAATGGWRIPRAG